MLAHANIRELVAEVRNALQPAQSYLQEPSDHPAVLADAREGLQRALELLARAADGGRS